MEPGGLMPHSQGLSDNNKINKINLWLTAPKGATPVN